jgi:hypothetical protein
MRRATGWMAGVRFASGERLVSSPVTTRPTLGLTQAPFQWLPGALSPGVIRQRREADYSSQSTAEVKKVGAIPPLPNMSPWHMS